MTTLLQMIAINPPAAIVLSFIGLLLIVALLIDTRKRRIAAAVLLLAPLTPLFALRLVGIGIVSACDAVVSGRWATPMTRAAHYIEKEIGL